MSVKNKAWVLLSLLMAAGYGCKRPAPPKEPTRPAPVQLAGGPSCLGATFKNLAYAKDKHTRLDVFLPAKPRELPVPWVMWVHGGGWAGGTRESVDTFALRQTCRGYAVVAVDYRLSHEARYPAALSDLRAALRFLRVHASKYDLDPTNVVMWGASAGAHLASLMALTTQEKGFDRRDDPHRKVPLTVRGIIGWWTPTSFSEFDADFGSQCPGHKCHTCAGSPESRFIGCEVKKCADRANRASPMQWVTAQAPPFLLSHGTDDCTVPVAQSTRFAEALAAAGASVELQIVPGARHGDGMWLRPEVMAHVDRFLDSQLQAPTLSGLPPALPPSTTSPPQPFALPSVQPSPRGTAPNMVR